MLAVIADPVSTSDEKLTIPGCISFEHTFREAGTGPIPARALQVAPTPAVEVSAGTRLKKAATGSGDLLRPRGKSPSREEVPGRRPRSSAA